MNNRICQICQEKKPMDNFYTMRSYICKDCHTIVTNVTRFKKVIKSKGIDFATDILIRDRLMLETKQEILAGQTINEACRIIKRGYKI